MRSNLNCGIGHNCFYKRSTVIECANSNAFNTLGNCYIYETSTIIERIISNAINSGGDGSIYKAGTSVECILTNALNVRRNCNTVNGSTSRETVVTDLVNYFSFNLSRNSKLCTGSNTANNLYTTIIIHNIIESIITSCIGIIQNHTIRGTVIVTC